MNRYIKIYHLNKCFIINSRIQDFLNRGGGGRGGGEGRGGTNNLGILVGYRGLEGEEPTNEVPVQGLRNSQHLRHSLVYSKPF